MSILSAPRSVPPEMPPDRVVPPSGFTAQLTVFAAAAMASSSLFVLGNALRLRRFGACPSGGAQMSDTSVVFAVSDMTCGHCSARVKKAAEAAAPGSLAEVDLASGEVTLTPAPKDAAAVAAAIEQAGYPARLK